MKRELEAILTAKLCDLSSFRPTRNKYGMKLLVLGSLACAIRLFRKRRRTGALVVLARVPSGRPIAVALVEGKQGARVSEKFSGYPEHSPTHISAAVVEVAIAVPAVKNLVEQGRRFSRYQGSVGRICYLGTFVPTPGIKRVTRYRCAVRNSVTFVGCGQVVRLLAVITDAT